MNNKLDKLFPRVFIRRVDSNNAVIERGVQESTYIRRMTDDEKAILEKIEGVFNN